MKFGRAAAIRWTTFLDMLLLALPFTADTLAMLADGVDSPCQVRRARLQAWRIGNQHLEQQPR